jgi:hypothetical protein
MHPFKVFADAIFGNVAVHPMPPYAGHCGVGWCNETNIQCVFEDVFFVCEKAANEHSIAVTKVVFFS